MIDLRRVRIAHNVFAMGALALLAGCIDSAQPLLNDGAPLIGQRARLEIYVLRDGAAREGAAATFAWRNGRYVPVRGTASDIHDFTLHAFAGDDLIVQSLRRGHPAEYGVARKLADGPISSSRSTRPTPTRRPQDILRHQRRHRLPRRDARGGHGLCARQRRQAAPGWPPCFVAQTIT